VDRGRTGFLLCLALASFLTCLVGRAVLFGGKTFTPTDFLTSRAPWAGEHATDALIKNRLHQDVIEYDAMHAIAAKEALQRGSFFLWNPRILCGVPSMGDPQLVTFYLPRLVLLRLLPPLVALDALILLHFLAAGLAMYALARTWGMSVPAALTSSLAWMLCGQQMVWFKYAGGLPAAVFLPLIALALRRGTTERSLGWIAGAGALWAAMLMGSHPQLSFLALAWTAVFLLCQGKATGWPWTIRGGAVFAAFAVGLGALQLFPFLESLLLSQKLSTQDTLIYARPARIPLLIATLFWQRAFGSPLDRVDLTNAWTGSNFFEFQGYMGLLPLVLAGVAARRSRMLAAAALALLGLATFYPLWWLVVTILPFLRMLGPHRLYLFAFAVSILAGLGLDALLEKPPSRRLLMGAAGIASAILGIGLVGWARSATWLSLVNPAYAAMVTAALLTVVALRVLGSSASARVKAAAVGIAIVGDLLPGFLGYNSTYEALPPEPEAIRRLPRDGRVLVDLESPYYRTGVGNFLMAYGRPTPSGYASQYPRAYGELARALGGRVGDRRVEFAATDDRAHRLLNVATVLSSKGRDRINRLPRAWLVGACEVLPEPADRLKRLADPSFDPARSAVVETPLRLDGEAGGSVEQIGDLEYRVDGDRSSLLVVSETFAPGWICDVDGVPQPILRANHAMRAVELRPGTHRVTFSYRPGSLIFGAACSAITLAIAAGWVLWRRFRKPTSTASSG